MSQPLAVDEDYVTEQIEKEWNRWTVRQRMAWLAFHVNSDPDVPDMAMALRKYNDLSTAVLDALFANYLDNSKKDFE